jgi:outer membrane immunogenic protein
MALTRTTKRGLSGVSALALALAFTFAAPQGSHAQGGLLGDMVGGPHDWSGPYIGAHGGYAVDGEAEISTTPVFSIDMEGFVAGGHAGYNWQVQEIVFGVEGDVDYSDVDGSAPCPSPAFTCSFDTDFLASVRARAGLSLGPALLYVTGGVAFTDLEFKAVGPAPTARRDSSHVGYVFGGGMEWMVAHGWSARLEGLYYGFGDDTTTVGGIIPLDVDLSTLVVRAGISVQLGDLFGGP